LTSNLIKAENRVVEVAGLIQDLGHLPDVLPWDLPIPAIKTADKTEELTASTGVMMTVLLHNQSGANLRQDITYVLGSTSGFLKIRHQTLLRSSNPIRQAFSS
jgi:hypothetical protein